MKILLPLLLTAMLVAQASEPAVSQVSKPAGLGLSPTPSLKSAAQPFFQVGLGISDRLPERTNDWPLVLAQFNMLTPENCLKPDPVQRREGEFNFGQGDAFVAFARQRGLGVIGHCLLWPKDDRTPPWFYLDGTNQASRELLYRRLKTHIDAVAGRYRGRVVAWDVVNEVLDDGTNFLRPSGWTRICGEEFVARAFEYAHAADPEARLVLNDYHNELPDKREKMLRLLERLRQVRAPVHAVGLQGHYELGKVPFEELDKTLAALQAIGTRVVVSELDIDVVGRARWWADGNKYRDELSRYDPYREGCPPEILAQQAAEYARLFALFRKYAGIIERVSFWNLHDGDSWLNYFPWRRHNHPLLFDRQGAPKPAYASVLKALESAPPSR